MKFLFGLLLLFPILASANDHYIIGAIGSYHADRDFAECEVNPGALYQHFIHDNWFVGGGAFRNSHCNTAANAFVGWESKQKKRLLGIPYGYGALAGVTTGYPTPYIGAPYIRIGDRDDRVSLKLLGLPHPTEGILALGVKIRLGK